VLLADVIANPGRRVLGGEVGGEVGGRAWERLGQRPEPVLAARDEDQAGAGLTGETASRGLPDSARGARDQGDRTANLGHLHQRYSNFLQTAAF
jgi:hypothetical protein